MGIRISPLSQSLRQILTHLPTTKTANMIIYKDILTGDEIISDSYDLKEVDGAVYEVDCAMITLGAVEVNTGANASAEEAEEGVEDGALQVNNVVNSFRLNSTQFDKKIVANFKDYDFYIGESMDPDGMVVLMNYREDGVTPFVTVWKHGLVEMKV